MIDREADRDADTPSSAMIRGRIPLGVGHGRELRSEIAIEPGWVEPEDGAVPDRDGHEILDGISETDIRIDR